MPEMFCDIDVSALEHAALAADSELRSDLHRAGIDAAKSGIELARASHPYTDRTGELTGNAHVEEDHATGGGIMVWAEEYAGYVDEGTSRARAYPFTPKAKKLAGVMLNAGVNDAIARFKRALER